MTGALSNSKDNETSHCFKKERMRQLPSIFDTVQYPKQTNFVARLLTGIYFGLSTNWKRIESSNFPAITI